MAQLDFMRYLTGEPLQLCDLVLVVRTPGERARCKLLPPSIPQRSNDIADSLDENDTYDGPFRVVELPREGTYKSLGDNIDPDKPSLDKVKLDLPEGSYGRYVHPFSFRPALPQVPASLPSHSLSTPTYLPPTLQQNHSL